MKIINNRFSFATTIGILSGHPRFDKQTAQIIDALKAQSKDPLEFVGVIGDQYASKLSKTYASTSALDHEEVVVTRNYKESSQQAFINPYRVITHFKNHRLLQSLKAKFVYQELFDKKVPAVISVGNFSLARRFYTGLNQFYEDKNALKPLRLHFDLLMTTFTLDHEAAIDFLYHNLPRVPENLTRYTFPSMCIGYEGLFRAFQFLQKHRQNKDASFKNSEFSIEVNDLVRKVRTDFRKSKGFSEDQYLTFFAPGSTEKQAKFSFKSFKDGLSVFAQNDSIKNVDKGFFKILVLLPENEKVADLIKSQASSLSQKFEVSFVQESEKYAAMCGSDFAVLHNGEITVEAAACQLPALIVNSISNYNAYLSYLYNGHESPLNISTNFHGYEELMGSLTAIGQKVGTSMLNHFQKPRMRFYYAKLYRNQIQKMLMLSGRDPQMRANRTGIEAAAEDILKKIGLRETLPKEGRVSSYDRKERLQIY